MCSRRESEDTHVAAINLSLRKLEAFTRAWLPRFFPLFHARIAAKQPFGLERTAQIGIDLQERT